MTMSKAAAIAIASDRLDKYRGFNFNIINGLLNMGEALLIKRSIFSGARLLI